MTNLWKKETSEKKTLEKIGEKKTVYFLKKKPFWKKSPFVLQRQKQNTKKKKEKKHRFKKMKTYLVWKKKTLGQKNIPIFWQKQFFLWNNKQPFWEKQPLTMTMTRTHSNKVSIRCEPCPTDSNGEVVTSAKKESVKVVGILHSSQVERSIPVRRQVVTRTLERKIWILEFSNVHHFKDACHSLQSCSAKNWLWVAPVRRKKLTPGQSLVDLLRTLCLSRPVNELCGSRVHDNPYQKKKVWEKTLRNKTFLEKKNFLETKTWINLKKFIQKETLKKHVGKKSL